jgi:hypothetical protein
MFDWSDLLLLLPLRVFLALFLLFCVLVAVAILAAKQAEPQPAYITDTLRLMGSPP